MKSVLTIHNLAYQGIFSKWDFLRLGLSEDLYSLNGFEFYGDINWLKAGIIFSDRVTTVSPGYAKEIQTDELGCGLAGVIRKKQNPIAGILNGIDYQTWNPETDRFLVKRYGAENVKDKMINKRKLQESLGFKVGDNIPLFGFVARLSAQKGLDLIARAVDDMMKMNVQMVFLGTGDGRYGDILKDMARRYPKKIAVDLEYDEPMAHLIYAGCDIFLMPSVFEPCGLSQMISLRYGTIPLVHKTGGLADTIVSFDSQGGRGNGFVFGVYKKSAFVDAVKIAVSTYKNKKVFDKLVVNAFSYDFSWEKSAKQYEKLYRQCLQSA